MEEERIGKIKDAMADLIEKSMQPCEIVFEKLETELRELVNRRVPITRIVESLNQNGYKTHRKQLSDWLEKKGMREKRKRGE